MSCCSNQSEYYDYLRSLGGLPLGFKASVSSLTFLPRERPSEEPYRMNIAAVVASEPCSSFAGVFTKNAVPGAPVLIGRKRLEKAAMHGILVNNRISNVAARDGQAAALRLTAAAETILGIDPGSLFPSSTGIIGWQLPEDEMLKALPGLLEPLKGHGSDASRAAAVDSAAETVRDPANETAAETARKPGASPESADSLLAFARAIMTTDSYPKIRVRKVGRGRIVGVVKGAGMIEPDMATMLGFIFTDLQVPRDALREILKEAVDCSFNRISVDSDQSTSDMVLAFSSGKIGVELEEFQREFTELCRDLSMDIVRNGEGTAHVMDIEVCGSQDPRLSREIGKAVANSPL
nr:bifunctional ornithine acetyltransferase/N-acetylglutamate synthase [Salinispira pacifica]